jgi:hypothetical protein
LVEQVLFLAGSAINSIQDAQGRPSPQLGAAAMLEALEVHRAGQLADVADTKHLEALLAVARARGMKALLAALRQRYPETTL